MKRIKLCAMLLILLLAAPTFAGHIESGATAPPPPEESMLDPLTQIALDLLNGILSLF